MQYLKVVKERGRKDYENAIFSSWKGPQQEKSHQKRWILQWIKYHTSLAVCEKHGNEILLNSQRNAQFNWNFKNQHDMSLTKLSSCWRIEHWKPQFLLYSFWNVFKDWHLTKIITRYLFNLNKNCIKR